MPQRKSTLRDPQNIATPRKSVAVLAVQLRHPCCSQLGLLWARLNIPNQYRQKMTEIHRRESLSLFAPRSAALNDRQIRQVSLFLDWARPKLALTTKDCDVFAAWQRPDMRLLIGIWQAKWTLERQSSALYLESRLSNCCFTIIWVFDVRPCLCQSSAAGQILNQMATTRGRTHRILPV